MKNAKHYFLVLFVLLLSACSDNLMNPIPTIKINPGFNTPGFVNAGMVSLNETDTKAIAYARVYGISRALTMKLNVDESLLNAYNASNGTNYKLLPAEYYSMPTTVTFEVKSKNANFEVKFNSKKLYEATGSVEVANSYVLPIRAIAEDANGVDLNEDTNTMLLHVNMAPVTVSVYVPSKVTMIDFVANSGAVEKATIEATVNFAGLQGSHITMEVDKNAGLSIDGVDYLLLPEANFTFESAVLNALGEVEINGKIDANGLLDTEKYILPCRIVSSNPHYNISQSGPVYFAVGITELKVSITDASATKVKKAYSSITSLTGEVEVIMNSMIADDLTINFNYDPLLIAEFNNVNATTYQTLPAGTIQINSGKISSGSKSGKFAYTIDISSLTLSDGKHYLVPFVLNENDFELGSISGSKVIYLDVTRTLEGTYNLTIIANERKRNVLNEIWLSSECDRGGDSDWKDVMDNKAQYGFGGDGKWYSVLFSVTNNDMPGMANCKKVEIYTFLELIVSTGGTNDVKDNNSYFNTVTGELYIDCKVYESWFDNTYKETYSFKRL